MSSVPNITEAEQWAVETTLKERRPDRHIELQLADAGIKMYPQDRELTVCPAMFREANSTSFVIIKVTDRAFCSQFYHCDFQQYGTGKTHSDDITVNFVIMLQVHANRKPGTVKSRRDQYTEFQNIINNPEDIQ